MQIKVDIGTAGDKSWVRVVDQHTGISREKKCWSCHAKDVAIELKILVEKQVKEQANATDTTD
jgi:hypothetical protein